MAEDWENDENVVAVMLVGDGQGKTKQRSFMPIHAELARAINEGEIASFNVFSSLALREQIIMARLYRQRERVARQRPSRQGDE